MTINVLGTEYTVTVKKYDEEEAFERRSIGGYCDSWAKQIVVCDMSTYKGWEHELPETIAAAEKETLRHEIVHAFLSESGLADSSLNLDGAWAKNEEMVDWVAIQGPKIYKVWQEAGGGMSERKFPVIGTNPQEYIPWGILAPHEKWALRNHAQTLEQLAKRGGLDWNEIISILEDKPWRSTPLLPPEKAKKIVLEYVSAWEVGKAGPT